MNKDRTLRACQARSVFLCSAPDSRQLTGSARLPSVASYRQPRGMFGLLASFAAILPQGCQNEVVAGRTGAQQAPQTRVSDELEQPTKRPRATTAAGSGPVS
jgi:hypothetical protein